jgi:hypothetical protein
VILSAMAESGMLKLAVSPRFIAIRNHTLHIGSRQRLALRGRSGSLGRLLSRVSVERGVGEGDFLPLEWTARGDWHESDMN